MVGDNVSKLDVVVEAVKASSSFQKDVAGLLDEESVTLVDIVENVALVLSFVVKKDPVSAPNIDELEDIVD